MRTVRSGSGVIWPAALSGFTESHSISHILVISKKSLQKDGYITQRRRLFTNLRISLVIMFTRRLNNTGRGRIEGWRQYSLFFTHLTVCVKHFFHIQQCSHDRKHFIKGCSRCNGRSGKWVWMHSSYMLKMLKPCFIVKHAMIFLACLELQQIQLCRCTFNMLLLHFDG